MPIIRKPDVALFGIQLHGGDLLFDGKVSLPGNHLRWNFNAEMGFPPGGFTLSRAVWNPQFAMGDRFDARHGFGFRSPAFNWSVHLNLPSSQRQALSRIRQGFSTAALNSRFSVPATDLVRTARQLRSSSRTTPMYLQYFESTSDSGLKSRLRKLDLILMAALDPYLARMLGLYYIDNAASPSETYLYKITGHWGGTTFPEIPIDFGTTQIRQKHQTLQFGPIKVISAGRVIGVRTPENFDLIEHPQLTVYGTLNPSLKLHFDFPVEEVILDFDPAHSALGTRRTLRFLADGVAIRARVEGNQIRINRSGNSFERLDFLDLPGGNWAFFKFRYRKRVRAIGDLATFNILKPAGTQPVPRPQVARLIPEEMPSLLNEDGEVNNEVSQVSIAAGLIKPNIDEIDVPGSTGSLNLMSLLNPPLSPVRLLFGASSPRSTVVPQRMLNLGADGTLAPSLFRENSASVALPELLGYWPFNGHLKNEKDGAQPLEFGNPRFVKDHLNEGLFSLRLNGNDALQLRGQDHLKKPGKQFTLEATIKIDPTNTGLSTLIGNKRQGFWLGLVRSGENYLLRLYINNRPFNGVTPLPPNSWVRISASYSGEHVWFQYSGQNFSVPENTLAAPLGPVKIMAGNAGIGSDNGSTASRLLQPFSGNIADVCIWQGVFHPSESSAQLAKWSTYLSQQHGISEMVYNDPKTYVCSTARDPILIDQTTPLKALSDSLSVFLFINPSSTNIQFPTLLGNKYNERFWIGLMKSGSGYKLRVWLNRKNFNSTRSIPADQWSHVGMSYDGRYLSLYINGMTDRRFPAGLGPLAGNDLPVGIGSDAGTTVESQQYRLNGFVHGVQFWRKAINATQWVQKTAALQHIDRHLANGRHFYAAKGVDLYGRASEWSRTVPTLTRATPTYQPPVNVHATFLPLTGSITRVDDTPEDTYILTTSLELSTALSRKIRGYDAVIRRSVRTDDPTWKEGDPVSNKKRTIEAEQLLEIISAESVRGRARLTVKKVSFAQLFPEKNDEISIKLDNRFKLNWAWTGTQQLYFPEVNAFRLYELKGTLNEITGRVTGVTSASPSEHRVTVTGPLSISVNELNNEKCLLGPHMFTIQNHTTGANPVFTVSYDGKPDITPKVNDTFRVTLKDVHSTYVNEKNYPWRDRRIEIPTQGPHRVTTAKRQTPAILDMKPVSPAELKTVPPRNNSVRERQRLLGDEHTDPNDRVDWFPLSRVYKITFPRFARPANYTPPNAAKYIPGALVFFDNHPDRRRWRSFYVLWHQWETRQRLVVYVTPGEKEEAPPVFKIDGTHNLRFYLGKQYEYLGQLSGVPNLGNTQPTLQYHLALTAKDSRRRASLHSRRTTMVAVHRGRPATGPKPKAVIDKKADYYDQCQVAVTWAASRDSLIKYKLYRDNDSSLYARDLELRRTRQAFYKDLSPQDVFSDDADFNVWFRTLRPRVSLNALFPAKDSAAWERITPIWRKWADRFYPALTDAELNDIGMRAGNEKAFALITGKPISEPNYIDSVNGVVNNRYYYRIRLINEALSESVTWGPLSDPVIPPAVMPPRQPVFSKIEAGDRQISLHWALNREPDLKEYQLYRGESKEEVEDLRWWSREADPRIIATVPDPRIKTSEQGLTLPGELPIATDGILGIYTLEEFDPDARTVTRQPQALNYWNPTPTDPRESISEFTPSPDGVAPHRITGLRRIADGKAVVVVYRDSSRQVQALTQLHDQIPYVDEGLEGLKDYYYRLVAVNGHSLKSTPSKGVQARPLELTAPLMPEFKFSRTTGARGFSRISIELAEPVNGLEVSIQRRNPGDRFWRTTLDWIRLAGWTGFNEEIPENSVMEYQLMVRSTGKRVSDQVMKFYSDPLAVTS